MKAFDWFAGAEAEGDCGVAGYLIRVRTAPAPSLSFQDGQLRKKLFVVVGSTDGRVYFGLFCRCFLNYYIFKKNKSKILYSFLIWKKKIK